MKNIKFILAVSFIISAFVNSQWVINNNPVWQGNMAKPPAGVPFNDPHFSTVITRITNARASGLPGVIPTYSKRQAWNYGETYLLLQTGAGDFRLYNGESPYQFIRTLNDIGGEDVFWHPVNPNVIIYNPANELYSYNIQNNQSTLIRSFSSYLYANTSGEGNLSNDGRYYAFVGRYNDSVFSTLNVYDFNTNTIISSLQLPPNHMVFDWISISPLGNYVVVDYADSEPGRFHGVEVYTRSFGFIWQKPLGAGHSDLGIDANGNEILVMDYYDSDSNKTFIKKFNLSSGQETKLMVMSYLFDSHISCRSELQRNYCFVSTFDYVGRLTADSSSWLAFENEVFAVKLDGSRQVVRIAHHHSRRFSPLTPDPDNSVYWAEPHASVSREGKRMVWGSNWEQNVQSDTSCDTYVCNFRNFPPISVNNQSDRLKYFTLQQNYPNPFNNTTVIKFTIPPVIGLTQQAKLVVYDLLGRVVEELLNGNISPGDYEIRWPGIKSSSLSSGVYYYILTVSDINSSLCYNETKKLVLIK